MDALLLALTLLDFVSLMVILFTVMGLLLDAQACTRRGTLMWIAFLFVGIGAGEGLINIGNHNPFAVLMHIGLAVGCVVRAPGPWWQWVRCGHAKYPERRQVLR